MQRLERRAALGAVLLATLAMLGCGLPIRTSHPDPAVDLLAEFPELAEWGDVIMIGGVEYWKPYLVRDAFQSSWEPYANGYLYDDEVDGLVWVSQDPWGFITEHYGYWRHHERYGFVWRPLYPIAWRPYVATIFYDGSGAILSWCPFSSEVWNLGLYVDDYGFDDDYWAQFWALADTPDFYPWFVSRCGGYPVPVTIYEPETYSRDQPEQCYRRQRDYRQHREVERGKGLEVVDRLPAQRAEPPQAPRTRSADPAPATPEVTPARGVSIDPVPREILVPKRRSQERPPSQEPPSFEMPARLPAQPRPAPALPRPRTEPVTPTLPPAAPAPAFSPAQRAPAVASPPRSEPAPTPPPAAAPASFFAPAQQAPAAASPARREPATAPPPSAVPPSFFTPVQQAPAATRESRSAAPAPTPPTPAAPAAPSPPPAAAPAVSSPTPEIRPAEASRPAAPSFNVERLRKIDASKLAKNDSP